ncbi:CBS domain-containing protein [Streptomyces sp. CB02959]|uniref:CBS domain-containing protein n=1 Tax=Streptomyces sp. CB02959 TaxID=2020330 RepID=UPI0026A54BBD|nr:CBS domain-containing protein [Streptomyces sp. CB02959]
MPREHPPVGAVAGEVGVPFLEDGHDHRARHHARRRDLCAGDETLESAARRMSELNIGSLPICGPDDRLHGIITDRDIVVKCLAKGKDPKVMTAGQLAQGKPVTIDVEADAGHVLQTMKRDHIRRLPIISDHRLVGMISEADLARHLSEKQVGRFVEGVCATA